MLDFLKLLSCILFAVAATLFFKKSFRREVIPDVFGLVLLGILTVSPCTRLVLDSADSSGVFKYAGPFAVITCVWFICYRYRHLLRDVSSTSVFMAFLLAILEAAISEWSLWPKSTAFSNFKLWKNILIGRLFTSLLIKIPNLNRNKWVFQTFFLSFFFSFFTATTSHEDYVQVDCVLLPRYKSVRKKKLKRW